MTRQLSLAGWCFLLMVSAAQAHTGAGDASGFAHGVVHPFGGLDHVLAVVAVGLFAANLGGRALWLVPAAFVSMMGIGGVAGVAGVEAPFIEIGIASSVIVLGAAIALNRSIPVAAAMALAGFFAIFHGHAHGAEMPADASGLGYAAGFMLATATLHAIGIGLVLGLGLGMGSLARRRSRRIALVGGGAVALAGVGLLTGLL